MEFMLIWIILVLLIIFLLIEVPIYIAKKRGITDSELLAITVLSWVGILIPLTWIVALVLAIVWKPDNWVDKKENTKIDYLEELEKLANLKDKGILSEAEFNEHKKRLMKH